MAIIDSERIALGKLEKLNQGFEESTPQGILTWVNDRFRSSALQMSSFGMEDVALFDMFWRIDPQARLATLDTWRLPTETYTVMDQTRIRYNVIIEVFQPNPDDVAQMIREHGFNLFYKGKPNRMHCCHIRKVEPLERALSKAEAWVTGLRRDQGMDRGVTKVIEWDEPHSCYKINPLVNWTFDQVREYIDQNNVPYNELHDQGYPSIGCAPCTRAVSSTEDPRAGRWWWESDPDAKECGLHVVAPVKR
jgi:phosphoadenosine phosphosulfate reductase